MKMSHLTLMALAVASIGSFSQAHAAEQAVSGQNAFTRMVKESLSDIVTAVPNPRSSPCNGVVDCRKHGRELETVWQVNHTGDYNPKDYPARCYVQGENGKYVYAVSACR